MASILAVSCIAVSVLVAVTAQAVGADTNIDTGNSAVLMTVFWTAALGVGCALASLVIGTAQLVRGQPFFGIAKWWAVVFAALVAPILASSLI